MKILRKIERMLPDAMRRSIKGFVFEFLAKVNFLNQRKTYLAKLKRLLAGADADTVFDKFCSVNSAYWEDGSCPLSGVVLVEGFLAEYGPNYLMRTGIITKALEKEMRVRPVVLLAEGDKEEPHKKKLYASFKITEYLGIYDDVYAKFSLLKKFYISVLARAYFYYAEVLFLFGRGERFIQLSFQDIQIGDMLYDELVKECPQQEYTIKRMSGKHYYFFKKTFVYFFVLDEIFKRFNIKYYVSTHSQYITYGLPLRYFHHRKVLCIETTDDQLFIHDPRFVPRYHVATRKMIADRLSGILNNEDLLKQAKIELETRFSGKLEQIDVKLAYCGKKVYTKQQLKAKLDIENDNSFVFIFAHIFSDTPRGSSKNLLFIDYYQWLQETIRCVSGIQNVNWVVKPHPSVKAYHEEGKVEDIVCRLNRKNSPVHICPSDFSTAGVRGIADAIVTCQGTVGLEYSCAGIPTVLAGAPFYSGFGFTYEPRSREEYFALLKNIRAIKPLTAEQIKTAFAVYTGFKSCFNTDDALIDTVLKSRVWGCEEDPDALGAYQMMTNRLARYDPKERALYRTVVDHFRRKES